MEQIEQFFIKPHLSNLKSQNELGLEKMWVALMQSLRNRNEIGIQEKSSFVSPKINQDFLRIEICRILI